MRSHSDDEFDDGDIDDFNDYDDLEREAALLTTELTDEFVRYLSEQWRIDEENKAINVDVSLASALATFPSIWADAACRAHRIHLRGRARQDRRAKLTALIAHLNDSNALARCVRELPAHARAALRCIIENGGWMRLHDLTRDFGSMEGDGWFWDEAPPHSSLGELRRRALLFIGKTGTTKMGKPGKRAFKVAVVPSDMRLAISAALSDPVIRRADENEMAKRFASPEEILADALTAARGYYASMEWEPPLTIEDVEGFLKVTSKAGVNPLLIWFNMGIVIAFIEHMLHEVPDVDHLCGYHISEMASQFVDLHYTQRWTLESRRSLIEVVRKLYQHLHSVGRVSAETLEDIEYACTRLCSSKRRLNVIHRPPPLGGELIFTRVNPNTGDEERYTHNHQRLLLVWATAFHQDWKTMLSVCELVPTGKLKAALIHELIALDPGICDLILSQVDEEDFDRAILWFYEERMLELSAW
jgi:hypothetical protein